MYLGNQPALSYTSFAKQDFTTSATTSYTLDNPVANENELALFINFVRQEPTTAYTASGTSLTLTSATSASDDMYCVFLGKAVQTVVPPSGSVGASQIASDAVTEAKIADGAVENEHLNVNVITGQTAETSIATDDTILIHDTSASALRKMTRANFVSGVGGTNTPNFEVSKTDSNQSLSNNSVTKVTFNNEIFDSDSAFASDKFTVPSGKGGKYFLYSSIKWNNDDRGIRAIYLYKNGSYAKELFNQDGHDQGSQQASVGAILNLSAGDYIEVYCYQTTGDPENIIADNIGTYFGGFKLI